jgi:hypothetical protein
MGVKLGLSHQWKRVRVFQNKVMRRIFGLKRDDVTGERRKLHSEELHCFYSSPTNIRQIKSRRMKWIGHVARMGERKVYKVLVGRPEGKNHLEDQGVDGIRMDFRKIGWGVWIGFDWLRIGTDVELL